MQIDSDRLYDSRAVDEPMPRRNGPGRALERAGLQSLAAVSSRSEFEPFRIDVHPGPERVRVAPVGELDLATVPQLRERLEEVRESGCRSVVLDLRGLTFIDSSGLHLTVSWDSHARESQIEFVIIQGPPAVRRVFDITGLLDRLPFRGTSGENGASLRPTTSPLGQNADTSAPAR